MNEFEVSGMVKRFPGDLGWHYVEIPESIGADLRILIKGLWPALLRSVFKIDKTTWESSIMPIKNGPLFIAIPAKVRKAQVISFGDAVTVKVQLKDKAFSSSESCDSQSTK